MARQMTAGEDIAMRRKKLRYRAWHRGTKEMDLILGPFADAHADAMDGAQLDRLEYLDLAGTGITDETLGILKMHQALRTLVVTGTRVTKVAAREFEAGTPNCTVVFGPSKP